LKSTHRLFSIRQDANRLYAADRGNATINFIGKAGLIPGLTILGAAAFTYPPPCPGRPVG
jgi:hypothetical protein